MLKLAFPYKHKLEEEFLKTIYNDKYKYYHCSSWFNYQLKLSEDSWNEIEMVSVDTNDNVLGFLAATIRRDSDKVTSLRAINFYDLNYTFAKDFHEFLVRLFELLNMRKIEFTVVIGNPAEKMYDKYIEKYGGKITGYYRETVKLYDGNFYDMKSYELFREDYLRNKKR